MTWTYSGDPTATDRDAVRFYVGDTDLNDPLIEDAEIDFLLQSNPEPIAAAAAAARAIASKMSRLVDEKFESIDNKFSQRASSFHALAVRLERDAKKLNGFGAPVAGGIRESDVETAQNDVDRVKPAFRSGQFSYPQVDEDGSYRWR